MAVLADAAASATALSTARLAAPQTSTLDGMSALRVLLYAVAGLLAYCAGWLVYPLAVELWGFLLKTIAWPESRWGADGSRLVGEALRPAGDLVIVGAVSALLAVSSARLAVRFSLLIALGTLSYFSLLLWLAGAPLWAANAWLLEGFFFVVLLPLVTAGLVRVGPWSRTRTTGRSNAV